LDVSYVREYIVIVLDLDHHVTENTPTTETPLNLIWQYHQYDTVHPQHSKHIYPTISRY